VVGQPFARPEAQEENAAATSREKKQTAIIFFITMIDKY